MTSPLPLLIIMGTIVGLVLIQRALTKIEKQSVDNQGTVIAPPPPVSTSQPQPVNKSRGLPLFPGLSVVGMDVKGVEQLKNLINSGDSVALTAFLANHRPGILELDEYLNQLRVDFNAALPGKGNQVSTENIRNALQSFTPPKLPAGMHFDLLDEPEYEVCLLFNPNSQRLITRQLMAQFGGKKFGDYFKFYSTKNKSVALHVPPLDPERDMFEALVESGVASQGRQMPLSTRLTVLKMNEIRQMCKDLNHDKKYTRKQEATEALAELPGAAVLLSMSYVINDLFVLNPINSEKYDINREWNFLSAYAKLLISRMNTNRSS